MWYLCWNFRCAPQPWTHSTLRRALQVALKYADVNERCVGGIRTKILASEAYVVRRLVLRFERVGVRIGERVCWRLADHRAGTAANIGRHSHVSRNVIFPDADPVTDVESLARNDGGSARCPSRR